MPLPDFTIGQNDSGEFITATLPLDLTGLDVTFLLAPISGGDLVVDAPATMVGDPTEGAVIYEWQSDDTAIAGLFLASWRVAAGDAEQTFPVGGYTLVQIVGELGQIAGEFGPSENEGVTSLGVEGFEPLIGAITLYPGSNISFDQEEGSIQISADCDPAGSAAAAQVAAETASDPAGTAATAAAAAQAAAEAASDPIGSAAAILAQLAGVVLRKSTHVGDATSTTATDGVVTKTGAGSTMTFTASGGLFRLSDGTMVFHETHAWTPSGGDPSHSRIDTIWVAVGPGTDDSQCDPAAIGAGYEYNTGQPGSSPNPAPPSNTWTAYVPIAQILVPANALHANDCTVTDLRRFV